MSVFTKKCLRCFVHISRDYFEMCSCWDICHEKYHIKLWNRQTFVSRLVLDKVLQNFYFSKEHLCECLRLDVTFWISLIFKISQFSQYWRVSKASATRKIIIFHIIRILVFYKWRIMLAVKLLTDIVKANQKSELHSWALADEPMICDWR